VFAQAEAAREAVKETGLKIKACGTVLKGMNSERAALIAELNALAAKVRPNIAGGGVTRGKRAAGDPDEHVRWGRGRRRDRRPARGKSCKSRHCPRLACQT
jgi:hypothetical protein